MDVVIDRLTFQHGFDPLSRLTFFNNDKCVAIETEHELYYFLVKHSANINYSNILW